ncbi:uncharacterized protein F4822DRAFT_63160 [Hypoxylon trugodes]|uniref:uncharacterized protein n=1 Tax=Hypoxylon trugodes TaxID=326681 RepID=UPI0021989C11|nr:uncharacterized protein F4822DRAFT_63160 [Hypoxylon trugodes]KAI1384192.1 hypothetical protein F4822DRAFT_63160 [Hypoxylon trugodes]
MAEHHKLRSIYQCLVDITRQQNLQPPTVSTPLAPPYEYSHWDSEHANLFLPFLIRMRPTVNAWEWEHHLLSPSESHYLRMRPCYTHFDSRILALSNDWMRILTRLCSSEHQLPRHQFANREPYAFTSLHTLVHKLHDLISEYDTGVPEVRGWDTWHRTLRPYVPRSGVAEARSTIAVLVSLGFGAWLEDVARMDWRSPQAVLIHNFAFDVKTGILGWANVEEGNLLPRPRIRLDLMFPDEEESEEEKVVVETVSKDMSPHADILAWLDGVVEPDVPYSRPVRKRCRASLIKGISNPLLTQYKRLT